MTKIETAELAELGMSPEQLQERREKLAATLNQSAVQIVAETPVPTSVDRGPEKQQRTTVGKLLKRYQERVATLDDSICDAKTLIDIQQELVEECERQRTFWAEAIAEIERD